MGRCAMVSIFYCRRESVICRIPVASFRSAWIDKQPHGQGFTEVAIGRFRQSLLIDQDSTKKISVLHHRHDIHCWHRRRIDPVAETSLTQSNSSRIIVCAEFVQVWRWVSLASARGSIRRRRPQSCDCLDLIAPSGRARTRIAMSEQFLLSSCSKGCDSYQLDLPLPDRTPTPR